MTGQFLPGAAWRPVSYRAESGTFTAPPIGYIVHVQVGNGSPYGTFAGAVSPSRRFSHGWVAKDGHSEQYAELTFKSWAQAAGNGQYWSFETEGYPGEPLTAAQINTLATWHNFLGAPDRLADAPGQPGSGTHYMGGASYGGHTCPGPGPRAAQRWDIILRARQLRGSASPSPAPARPTPPPPPQEDDMLTLILWCYAQLVGRTSPPSVPEVENWITGTPGWTAAQVLDGFLNSRCELGGVVKAYHDYLGRAPESQAVIDGHLAGGKTIRQVRLALAQSPEAHK